MIQEVVTRRDFRKHLADFARSVRFGLRAFRASPLHRGGCFRHWSRQNRRRNEEQSAKRARQPPRERGHTKPPCRAVASAQIAASLRVLSYPSATPQSTHVRGRAATRATAPCAAQETQFAKRR